jgi:hypothetical protein
MILTQQQKHWETEKAALQAERDLARTSERRTLIDATITEALKRARVTAEGQDLLAEQLGARVALETVGGKRVVTILAADGKTAMVGTGPNGSATFADLVAEHTRLYPSLFEGTGAGGSGMSPHQLRSRGNILTRAEFDALPPLEKSAKSRSHKIVD